MDFGNNYYSAFNTQINNSTMATSKMVFVKFHIPPIKGSFNYHKENDKSGQEESGHVRRSV